MRFRTLLRNAKREHWKTGLGWLLYTVAGIFFPLLIGFVMLLLFKKWQGVTSFLSHGELCIYAASLLALILYYLDKVEIPPGLLKLWIYASALMVSVLYSATVMRDVYSQYISIDERLLLVFSLVIFAPTIFISYFVKVLDYTKSSIEESVKLEDAKREWQQSERQLVEDFDRITPGVTDEK